MKKNPKLEKESHILVLGELDIILKIDFKDEDLEIKPEDDSSIKKGGPKKYYKFRHLNEISSLSFLQNNNDIINRIQLTSKKEQKYNREQMKKEREFKEKKLLEEKEKQKDLILLF